MFKKQLTNVDFIYIMFKASKNYTQEVDNMKRTFQPNNRKKTKKQGFFARMKTKIINRRRQKGRKVLSH